MVNNNPIVQTYNLGQSIWYDQLSRNLIKSGELKRMIAEDGLLGMTTNPAIFEKSISEGEEYLVSLKQMTKEGASPYNIYDALVIEDVRDAAELYRPVYERTKGRDGFVSIEVNPELAHNTDETIKEAKRLFSTLNLPNIMIKVPATEEGLPAIENLISEGININVTLIFSIDVYIKVTKAYINGIKRRIQYNKPVSDINSVASFFVSRIDTSIDKMIEEKISNGGNNELNNLKGLTAVANARLAYQKFKEIFYNSEFQKLGANIQRPLWASTGTKNPAYSDIKYVDELIGKDTVNTIPPATYNAFLNHGKPSITIENDIADMKKVIAVLNENGISLDAVTKKLSNDGVAAFIQSFRNLLKVIESKMHRSNQ